MSFPKKLYIKSVFILGAITVSLMIIVGISSYFALSDTSKYGMIATLLFGFFLYPLNTKSVDWLDKKTDPMIEKTIRDAHSGRLGFEGEDTVYKWLTEIVGKEAIVRNRTFIRRAGNEFDIDLIAITSKGVIAVEVKNYTNPRYFELDEYFQEKDGKRVLLPPGNDPREEAKKHAFVLQNFLNTNGFEKVRVTKIVAFANGLVSWDGKTSVFIAKDKESLKYYIDGLEIDSDCTPEACKEIKSLLD